ncbi:MAG: glycosyltransferase, partial [Nocardioides sp.]|nr:glycosyltransferase [Nocardioides sp.]
RRFDVVIAVSQATADAIIDKWHPPRQIVVIPNGIDVADRVKRTPGLRILSLARLAPEKRLSALVNGFARLVVEHPGATLTLAGTGEEEAALRQQVDRLGLAGCVALPGFVDPVAAMAEHDVLAMLSIWENCSYALLDAAAAGMGVVSSDVGGNPEILPVTSLVTADDAEAVADALARQGLELSARPGLTRWPTVAEMTSSIARCYDSTAPRS